MTEESPWTSIDNAINLVVMIIFLSYSTFMLIYKAAWLFLALYWVFIAWFFIIGPYTTCRHCDYLGKPCPSWYKGILGGKLYKRSEKENFCKEGFLIPFLTDILELIIAFSIPIIAYLTAGLQQIDWILLIVYIVLLITTLGIHNFTGCRKCEISDCPLSGKKQE